MQWAVPTINLSASQMHTASHSGAALTTREPVTVHHNKHTSPPIELLTNATSVATSSQNLSRASTHILTQYVTTA